MVTINGNVVPVSAGTFSLDLAPAFGVNPIDVVATEGGSDATRVALDVLWADQYLPDDGAATPSLTRDDGLSWSLGAGELTGGAGTVLSAVVSRLDIEGSFPNGGQLSSGTSMDLWVKAVHLSGVTATTTLIDGGAAVTVTIDQLTADTEGTMLLQNQTVSLAGAVTYQLHSDLHISISKAAGQPTRVTLLDLVTTIDGATPAFDDPSVQDMFAMETSNLYWTLTTGVHNAFDTSVRNAMPAIFEIMLDSIQQSVGAVAGGLSLTAQTSSLVVNVGANIAETLRATASSSTGAMATSRGIASPADSGSAPAVDGRLQIALRLALLEALLHDRWATGGLDGDASELIPTSLLPSVTSARMHAVLPPILRAPRNGEGADLVLSLGQLELSVDIGSEHTRYLIGIDAGMTLGVANNRLTPTFGAPAVRIALLSTNVGAPTISEAALAGSVRAGFTTALASDLGDVVTILLPVPTFDALASTVAVTSTAVVSLSDSGPIGLAAGALRIDADLRAP
jgi:hypothetical protein